MLHSSSSLFLLLLLLSLSTLISSSTFTPATADDLHHCISSNVPEAEAELNHPHIPICVPIVPKLTVLDQSSPGLLLQIHNRVLSAGDVDVFQVDLRNLSLTSSGGSLFIHYRPENPFANAVETRMLLGTGMIPSVNVYTQKGEFTLQLSPHELRSTIYYASVTNVLTGSVNYSIEFSLRPSFELSTDFSVVVHAQETSGKERVYLFYNVSNGGIPPHQLKLRMRTPDLLRMRCETKLSGVRANFSGSFHQLVSTVRLFSEGSSSSNGSTSDPSNSSRNSNSVSSYVQDIAFHNDVYRCLEDYFEDLVPAFYGTTLPVCRAHELVERKIVKDCRLFGRFIGQQALPDFDFNVYDALQMCSDDLCMNGCKLGVMENWIVLHFFDSSIRNQTSKICDILAVRGGHDWDCVEGIGAGIFSTGTGGPDDIQKGLQLCESWVDPSAASSSVMLATWQQSCFVGFFERWMLVSALKLDNSSDFEAQFVTFCTTENIGTDEHFREACSRALGRIAALRANGNIEAAESICSLLIDSSDRSSTRTICLTSAREYLDEVLSFSSRFKTCPQENLHSIISYNLPPNYAETHASAYTGIGYLVLPWLTLYDDNTTFTLDNLRLNPPVPDLGSNPSPNLHELWWLSLNPNGARVSFALRLYGVAIVPPNPHQLDPFAITYFVFTLVEMLALFYAANSGGVGPSPLAMQTGA